MSDYIGSNSFMTGFMQGYSFVDDARRKKRDERRLEAELAEQRRLRKIQEDRAAKLFAWRKEDRITAKETLERQRRREDAEQEYIRKDREYQKRLRDRDEESYARQQEGRKLWASGERDIATLMPYAWDVPVVQQYIERQRAIDEFGDASRFIADEYAKQDARDKAAREEEAQLEAELEEARKRAAAQAASAGAQSYLGDDRSTGGLRNIDVEDELYTYDPSLMLDKSSFSERARAAVGSGFPKSALVFHAGPLPDDDATSSSIANALGGNVWLPDEYMTGKEIGALPADQQAAAAAENARIIEGMKALGREHGATGNYAALQEGSRILRDRAREQANVVEDSWRGFVDGINGDSPDDPLFNLAETDPLAFSRQYYNDRATLHSAVGERRGLAMDAAVSPYLKEAELMLNDYISASSGNERKKHVRDLTRLQTTQKEIYRNYLPTRVIGLHETLRSGVYSNNEPVIDALTQAVQDPNRPSGKPSNDQVQAAIRTGDRLATASEEGPIKEFSRKQIEHLYWMHERNLMSWDQVVQTLRTGRYPGPTRENLERYTVDNEDGTKDLYQAYTYGGDVQIQHVATFGKPKKGSILDYRHVDNILGEENIEHFMRGYQSIHPTADEEELTNLRRVMIQNRSWVESLQMDVSDPLQMENLGITWGRAQELADKEDNPIPAWAWGIDEAPSALDFMMSPALAAATANENWNFLNKIFGINVGKRVRAGVERFGIPESRITNFNVPRIRADVASRPNSREWPLGFVDWLYTENRTDAEIDQWLVTYHYITDPEFRKAMDVKTNNPNILFDDKGNPTHSIIYNPDNTHDVLETYPVDNRTGG